MESMRFLFFFPVAENDDRMAEWRKGGLLEFGVRLDWFLGVTYLVRCYKRRGLTLDMNPVLSPSKEKQSCSTISARDRGLRISLRAGRHVPSGRLDVSPLHISSKCAVPGSVFVPVDGESVGRTVLVDVPEHFLGS